MRAWPRWKFPSRQLRCGPDGILAPGPRRQRWASVPAPQRESLFPSFRCDFCHSATGLAGSANTRLGTLEQALDVWPVFENEQKADGAQSHAYGRVGRPGDIGAEDVKQRGENSCNERGERRVAQERGDN